MSEQPDLFSEARRRELAGRAPLAARLRPRTIDDLVGQGHLLEAGRPLRRLVDADALTSIVLWGPPGTGKTSLALAIAGSTSRHFVQLSAVTAGVKEVRAVIDAAGERLGFDGRRTILFLDEIHRFTKNQQDALLPAVEDGTITLIGATTENPFFEVNGPLLSRSTLFRLEPLSDHDLSVLVERGLEALGKEITAPARDHLVLRSAGDGRSVLTSLEVASLLADGPTIELADVERALGTSALSYGTDAHYDVASAFIKSIRGSDPQAAIHYLARMLEAGEDARFIARRLVIAASEDIGLADPSALSVAVAAAHALEFVGLPEAQLNLAQATLHLALAPKSNSAAQAIWTARETVRSEAIGDVPAYLRDAHYRGASSLGHGTGYRSPHESPSGHVDQEYLPEVLRGRIWYRPSSHGVEPAAAERLSP